MDSDPERHSQAGEAELITDPDQRTAREARNGLAQFDAAVEQIEYWLDPDRPFKLRPSAILRLNRHALAGLSSYSGVFRPANIEIEGSKHCPVGAHLVPEKVEELWDYVNERWLTATPIHLASYVLWRLNWIHPFTDGNGRTARATSFVVLSVRLGHKLYGVPSIPDQISADKAPYYKALEAADMAYEEGRIDLSDVEQLLGVMLARQLAGVLRDALGAHSPLLAGSKVIS